MNVEARVSSFTYRGVSLEYQDAGAGPTFVFQHGLAGDHRQTASLVPPCRMYRRVTLDCRGHGQSELGPAEMLSFDTFVEDLLSLLLSLGVERVALGGISMGAAVTLGCAAAAARHGLMVEALVLIRPAWSEHGMPEPARGAYAEISHLLRCYPPRVAAVQFERSLVYQQVRRQGPAAAASLLTHFDEPRIEDLVEVFERLPCQTPLSGHSGWPQSVPTLVLATDRDPIHPLALAQEMADAIGPQARCVQVTSKSQDPRRHAREVRQLVDRFLAAEAGSAR